MARTRAQRRRVSAGALIVLSVTLLVLVFARDVSRAAHDATTVRRSEDLSFGALANSLLTAQNQVDQHLAYLLRHGGTVSRTVMAARLGQIGQAIGTWSGQAQRLSEPHLAHGVGAQLSELTQMRAVAALDVIGDVERSLHLPGGSTSSTVSMSDSATTLETTAALWNRDRFALVHEPGRVHLLALATAVPHALTSGALSSLEQSANLVLTRAIGIAAVRVVPSPLPSSAGTLIVPPVSHVTVDVSVVNLAFALQPVTLTLTVRPLNGRGTPSTQRATATLAPSGAWAFSLAPIATVASERARLVVHVTGAPGGSRLPVVESYTLVLSPSGGG